GGVVVRELRVEVEAERREELLRPLQVAYREIDEHLPRALAGHGIHSFLAAGSRFLPMDRTSGHEIDTPRPMVARDERCGGRSERKIRSKPAAEQVWHAHDKAQITDQNRRQDAR